MSPELFQGDEKKSRASDIYAFGMTTLEVIHLTLQ
jgi:serine/threonine protein kinase